MLKKTRSMDRDREGGFGFLESVVIFLFIGTLIAFSIGILSSSGPVAKITYDDPISDNDTEARSVVNKVSKLIQENVSKMGTEDMGKISYVLDGDRVTIKAGDTLLDNNSEEDITVPDGVTVFVEGDISPDKTYYIVRATHEDGSKYNKDDHTWCVTKYFKIEDKSESSSNETTDYKDSLEKEYP